MSELTTILAELEELIMKIMKTGTVSQQEGAQMDALEAKLFKQKPFRPSKDERYENLGEEIAYLFFQEAFDNAVNRLFEYKIPPEDFFGFAQYHFEEEEETAMFTPAFIAKVEEAYQALRAK